MDHSTVNPVFFCQAINSNQLLNFKSMFEWFLIHDCESMAYHSTLYSSQSPNVEPRYSPDGRSNTVNIYSSGLNVLAPFPGFVQHLFLRTVRSVYYGKCCTRLTRTSLTIKAFKDQCIKLLNRLISMYFGVMHTIEWLVVFHFQCANWSNYVIFIV